MPEETLLTATSGEESLNEPGTVVTDDLFLTTFDGRSINLTNYVRETVIFEDMFSNVLMGHCVVVDAADIISRIPMQGTEFLTMSFRTPTFSESIGRTFFVTGLQGRHFSATDREQTYILSFMSIEGMIDTSLTLTRKYSGPTNKIIKDIFQEHLETQRRVDKAPHTDLYTLPEDHASTVTFVAPHWSPLKTINWVAARSTGQSYQRAPNYLFFESNKRFFFTSVEELIALQKQNKQIFTEYIYYPSGPQGTLLEKNRGFTYTKPEITKQFGMIRGLAPINQFNVLRSQELGYYSNQLLTTDVVLKQFRKYDYFFGEGYKQYHHLADTGDTTFAQVTSNKTRPFPIRAWGDPTNYRALHTKHYRMFDKTSTVDPSQWAQPRNSLLSNISDMRIHIEVYGRTDIEAGMLVYLSFPKGTDKEESSVDNFDPYMSGLYMITAIKHVISLNKHAMFLELVKDSFLSPLE